VGGFRERRVLFEDSRAVDFSLLANLQFYEKFGRQVAVGFGYNFPDDAYRFTTEQVQRIFEI
jgi:hypothetical protein